jgi:hypothetical protein
VRALTGAEKTVGLYACPCLEQSIFGRCKRCSDRFAGLLPTDDASSEIPGGWRAWPLERGNKLY